MKHTFAVALVSAAIVVLDAHGHGAVSIPRARNYPGTCPVSHVMCVREVWKDDIDEYIDELSLMTNTTQQYTALHRPQANK